MNEKSFNELMAVLNGLRSDFQENTKAVGKLIELLGRDEHASEGVFTNTQKKGLMDESSASRPNTRKGR